VDQELKVLFERALDDEPAAPGDPARVAMVAGTRLRSRRRLLVGGSATGVVAVLAAIVAFNLPAPGGRVVETAAGPAPSAASPCAVTVRPGTGWASVYLRPKATDAQKAAIRSSLDGDQEVRSVVFVDRSQAFVQFKMLWKDDPDFIKSVGVDQLPESFVVRLADPAGYPEFAAQARTMPGVQDVVDSACAPVTGK
jgi:hypothetical protein